MIKDSKRYVNTLSYLYPRTGAECDELLINAFEAGSNNCMNIFKQIVDELVNDGYDWPALKIVKMLYSRGITTAQTVEEFLKLKESKND